MNRLLAPHYFYKFKCIGSSCENTCCGGGWDILIDKSTYKKYRKSGNKNFNELVKNNIEINKNAKYDSDFAKIKLNDKKECQFLDCNKLCIIHKELGENALCFTCKTYPRIYNKVGDTVEVSFSMSCPEAARLALLNPDKMSFDSKEIVKNFLYYPNKTLTINEDLFWMVRIFSIELIQNRNFKMWQRMFILGLFFEEANAVIKNSEVDKVLDIINSFKYLLESGNVEELLDSFEVNTSFQLDIIKLINDTRVRVNFVDQKLEECIKSFNEGLQAESDFTEKQYEKYKKNYANYYAKYMDEHEFILENYFTNYIFINLFPFQSKDRDCFDQYCIMVLYYALIKAYLIGMSGESKLIDESLVIKLIHSLERTYHHGNKVLEYVFVKLKQGNKMNMKSISLLLKN